MSYTDMLQILRSTSAVRTFCATAVPALIAAIVAYAPTVRAEAPLRIAVGDRHETFLAIGEKQIPLPPGEWSVIASKLENAFTRAGSPIGKIGEIYLARTQNDRVTMALYVRTNMELAAVSGWVRNRSVCDRKNVHFNESDRNYNPAESECWQINHIVNTTNYTDSNVARQAFKAFQRAKFGTTTVIAPEFWLNDNSDMLFARYYLLPVRHGYQRSEDLKWKNSEWHAEAIRDNVEKKRFVAAARVYAKKLFPLVKQGFRGRIADAAASPDFTFSK